LGKTLGKMWRLMMRKPILLATEGVTEAKPKKTQPCAIRTAVLPRTDARRLRAAASDAGVSVNDVYLQQMMLHLRDWNQQYGKIRDHEWIRLAVPISMRTADHEGLPASNLVSYAFVTRRVSECRDPQELLKSIHQQTSDTLFHREGVVFYKVLRMARRLPFGFGLLLKLKPCLCTMVVANVGDARRRFSGRFPLQRGKWIAGNVVVDRIDGVAPVRPNTRAAVSIGDYAGDVIINLRTDTLTIAADRSDEFLAGYLNRLKTLADSQP
ncbi:MAG: hypothetical protein KDA96_12455, partial [Planctomycetaceae bacterium]|nr:hypothetical protein [Planctomycetaceae bacterium]